MIPLVRALIIEDDPVSLVIITRQLSKRGIEVIHAKTIPQALKLAASQAPIDIIFLDLSLEGRSDGIDLLKAREGLPTLRHIPVVVMSGYDQYEIISKCLQLGADDYLIKPVLRLRLLESLKKMGIKIVYD